MTTRAPYKPIESKKQSKIIYPSGFDKKADYCTNFPDKLFGVKFSYACYLHDRQYRNEVKFRKTRFKSNLDLWKDVYKIFKREGKGKIGWIVGLVMFIGVTFISKKYWIK